MGTDISAAVKKTILFRRAIGTSSWETIGIFEAKDSTNRFTDDKVGIKKTYEYTMIAVDDSGLESNMATVISSKRIDNGIRPAIDKVYSKVDRDKREINIAWDYKSIGVERIQIYKAEEGGTQRLYKTLEGDAKIFIDKGLTINTIYKYRIKAIYFNGAQTPFSKEIVVNY